ncbi:putative periplasmic binding proteins and sugar binding domain of the LacI family [Treponema primitia ZAS-2]|uniref:Putative periplasmic binding proteins and sugar binding domain of the LacI family n=1 Tax=Treponema primitia (strain ATCC BAA-887 / DSM 12427 / ZAS-2) TaxID=545694 RepID=F5YNB2_TREPZ|nr:LacI family DNA-binding transcriptional regulator [Treponema primitia]AEF85116.1 putative periplasmic binding proteins and sugar binding domain of the LacI family [Treponema primitia ZAS-2]
MAITIKEIASLAGVSRGTVDRVLHNRGRVNAEVRKRVQAIVQKLEYKPSRAAKQLAVQKQKLKFGIICRSDVRGFWSELLIGVDKITTELAEYEVKVLRRFFNYFRPEEHLALIDELYAEGISALAIVPLNDPSVRERLFQLKAAGITVVVLNSEIEGFEPFCYVGNDYYKSGRTAAGLLHLFARGKYQNIAVLKGTHYMMSHQQRIAGFMSELKALGTRCVVTEEADIIMDPVFTYEKTMILLKEHPDIDAIFTVAGNAIPVCQAIKDLGLIGRIIHISFDLIPAAKLCLIEGSMTAVIGQEAYRQGYLPLKVLFDYLVCGIEPEERHILTHNEIFIKQNSL